MNTPTHEEVTQRAHKLWQDRGRPTGQDTEIWLEAERQLAAGTSKSPSASGPHGPAGTSSEAQSASAMAEKAAQQRKEARAPILPHKTAPKAAPTESGKPLWDRPHSS